MPSPYQRAPAPPRKPVNDRSAQARILASSWQGRNLHLAGADELRRCQQALLACGVTPHAPYFDPPSRLLTRLTEVLDAGTHQKD